MAASTYFAQVQQLYIAYFGRPADPVGQNYWATQIDAANGSIASLIAGFSASTESAALFGNKSTIDKVTAIYQNAFGRAPEPAGLAYWVAQLDSGKVSQAQASWTIQQSAGPGDAAAVQNKLTAAQAFTAQIDTTAEIQGYQGAAAADSARAFLAAVTQDNATATAAVNGAAAAVVAATSVGIVGTTFTLTKGVDTLVGTSSNDIFVADNTVDTVISVADSVNGGAGTDTLKVYLKAADAVDALSLPQLSSVEKLSINSGVLSDTKTLDVSAVAGLESVAIESPVAVANNAAFTVKTTAAQNVILKNVTAATGDNFSVKLDGAVKATVDGVKGTGAGVATLDVAANVAAFALNATGAASAVTLTNSAAVTKLATLNITGDKAITVTEALTTLKTVDASANTGGVTLNVGATAVDLAFTGGTGADKIVIAGAQLDAKDALNGGAGVDTIVLSDTTAAYAGINKAISFEVLGLGATGTTVDVGQITNGINQFAVNVNGAAAFGATFANALSTSKFSINNDAGNGVITIGNKVGEAATSVAIDNQSAAAKTVTKLDVSGAFNVALASTGKVGSSNVITTLTNADNSNIVITGKTDLTITNALAGVTTGSKVDASALTGKLTVTGSDKSDVLIGGSNDDVLITGKGADILTGGAGKDTFVVKASVYGASKDITTITDFVKGTDKLTVATSTTDVTKVAVTEVTLAAALDQIAAKATAATTAAWGVFEGNTYVVADNDGTLDATSVVVKLAGTVDLGTTATVAAVFA